MHSFRVYPGAENFVGEEFHERDQQYYWQVRIPANDAAFTRCLLQVGAGRWSTRKDRNNKRTRCFLFTNSSPAPGRSADEHDRRNTDAICCPRNVMCLNRTKGTCTYTYTPLLGYALFRLGRIDAEVVGHESVHMATEFLRRTRRSVRLNDEIGYREECLAYATGICVAQLANYLHSHDLWGRRKEELFTLEDDIISE